MYRCNLQVGNQTCSLEAIASQYQDDWAPMSVNIELADGFLFVYYPDDPQSLSIIGPTLDVYRQIRKSLNVPVAIVCYQTAPGFTPAVNSGKQVADKYGSTRQ